MRASLLVVPLVLLFCPAALAQKPAHPAERRPAPHAPARPAAAPAAGGPHSIGTFEDWQAATHEEAGQATCYAFTRASAASPVPGRGDVVLTVTERPGASRDAVAVSAGYVMPAAATPTLQVEGTRLPFYTDGKRSAFARDGHAAVAALQHGGRAVFRAPTPRGAEVADNFSLRGFAQAYAAAVRACPAARS